MAALPYMPLYVADYLADAAHLSTLEHGAYLLLIMNYWQRGEALPADDKKLARIARVSAEEWADMRDEISSFFDEQDGLWVHGRIEAELDNVRSKSDAGKKGGKASAEARRQKKEQLATVVQPSFNGRSTVVQQSFNHTDTDTDTEKDLSLSETSSDPRVLEFPEKREAKPKRQRHAYSAAFEEFWIAYPTDPLMSKANAAKQFERLSDEDQRRAIDAIPGFRTHCQKNPDYRPVHAERFLSQRRFDGFARASPEAIPFDPIAHQANLDRILGRTKANA